MPATNRLLPNVPSKCIRESTHRHQQVCFWPDVSTFIPRSSSKDILWGRSWDKDRKIRSKKNKTCRCLWVLSLKFSPSVMPFKSKEMYVVNSFLSGSFLIKFSSLSSPTKIEELTAGSDEKTQPSPAGNRTQGLAKFGRTLKPLSYELRSDNVVVEKELTAWWKSSSHAVPVVVS